MQQIIQLLSQYKYLILFPLSIVEGPIIAIIVGFLCNGGLMNPLIAYPVIVAGDLVGDSICYGFGRLGVPKFIKKLARWFGLSEQNISRIRGAYHKNPRKIIALSKIALGIGVAGIYLAGNSKVPFWKFLLICLVVSVFQYILYMGLGLLFGNAYQQISRYLDNFAAFNIVLVVAILIIFLIRYLLKKYAHTLRF